MDLRIGLLLLRFSLVGSVVFFQPTYPGIKLVVVTQIYSIYTLGRLLSFWDGIFSGPMLNLRGVTIGSQGTKKYHQGVLVSFALMDKSCVTTPRALHGFGSEMLRGDLGKKKNRSRFLKNLGLHHSAPFAFSACPFVLKKLSLKNFVFFSYFFPWKYVKPFAQTKGTTKRQRPKRPNRYPQGTGHLGGPMSHKVIGLPLQVGEWFFPLRIHGMNGIFTDP